MSSLLRSVWEDDITNGINKGKGEKGKEGKRLFCKRVDDKKQTERERSDYILIVCVCVCMCERECVILFTIRCIRSLTSSSWRPSKQPEWHVRKLRGHLRQSLPNIPIVEGIKGEVSTVAYCLSTSILYELTKYLYALIR